MSTYIRFSNKTEKAIAQSTLEAKGYKPFTGFGWSTGMDLIKLHKGQYIFSYSKTTQPHKSDVLLSVSEIIEKVQQI